MKDKSLLLRNQKDGLIDSHTHIGMSFFAFFHGLYPYMENLENLIEKTKKGNINWIITFPLFDFSFDFENLFDRGKLTRSNLQEVPFELSNKHLLTEVRRFGEKVLPFLAIHPNYSVNKQCKKILEWKEKNEIFGLKLFTCGMNCTALSIDNSPFLDLLKSFGWPILIHSGNDDNSDPINVIRLAEKNPDIKVCVAHGARFKNDFWREIENHRNVYVDVSPFLLLCEDTLKKEDKNKILNLNYYSPIDVIKGLYKKIPTRLLWGTDEPFTRISRKPWNSVIEGGVGYKGEVKFLNSLDSSIVKNIAWRNTKEYLGLNK